MQRVETPDLLTFVNIARRTGLLEMERGSQSTRVFFKKGDIVFAGSTREGLRIGDLLKRMGRVSARDMERALARRRTPRDRVGEMLVAEGLLSEPDLLSFLKVQISEVVFDTFTWNEGRFAFYDDVAHPADVTTIDMNLQNLLMEGVRRIDERGRLAEEFPDLGALVESLANPEWVKENMSLTKEEWSVFFLVDGRRSLQEICQIAGNPDELATLAILNHLRSANLIGLVVGERAVESPLLTAPEPARKTDNYSVAGMAAASSQVLGAGAEGAPPAGAKPVSAVDPDATGELPPDAIPRRAPEISRSLMSRPLRPDDSASIISKSAIQYAAASAPSGRLVFEQSTPPVSYPLLRDAYTLGRGPKNDIVLQDANVSVFHARIDRNPSGYTLVDLRSTNGTSVNQQLIRDPVVLRPNDILKLGQIRLRYLED